MPETIVKVQWRILIPQKDVTSFSQTLPLAQACRTSAPDRACTRCPQGKFLCDCVSTPSAITTMPRLLAMPTMVWIINASECFVPMLRTKDWSIFSSCRAGVESGMPADEYPVPKSSRENLPPYFWCMHLGNGVGNVTSNAFGQFNLEAGGLMAVCLMISHTRTTKSGWRNWRALMLDRKLQITCVRGLFPISLFVCRRFPYPLPIGRMSPVSSASVMNCIGGTMPIPGCCQRNSASAPIA